MNWSNSITCKEPTQTPNLKPQSVMANKNHDNAAYLDFIQSLNEILRDFEISRLSCS